MIFRKTLDLFLLIKTTFFIFCSHGRICNIYEKEENKTIAKIKITLCQLQVYY